MISMTSKIIFFFLSVRIKCWIWSFHSKTQFSSEVDDTHRILPYFGSVLFWRCFILGAFYFTLINSLKLSLFLLHTFKKQCSWTYFPKISKLQTSLLFNFQNRYMFQWVKMNVKWNKLKVNAKTRKWDKTIISDYFPYWNLLSNKLFSYKSTCHTHNIISVINLSWIKKYLFVKNVSNLVQK